MQITKKIFRISFILPCLLCLSISFAQKIGNFTCNFEDPNSCQWTQDESDDFDWTRNRASTQSQDSGPLTDHTKGPLKKKQGPGSIQHSEGKCIHVLWGARTRPKEGQFLVIYRGCALLDRQEFRLWPNGILMLTKYGMCAKPIGLVTDGVKVGVFNSCNATDTWSWTAQGSLQYKKKMCLRPETGGVDPGNNVRLVLDSVCDERQNFFEFVPTSGWYLYIEASSPRQLDDKARLISPSTTEAKSCLLFFYHMYGSDVNELRVYVKSGGKMYSVWSRSGEQGNGWYQAQVAVNNQMASYQYVIEGVRGKDYRGDIAIDDISLIHSCRDKFFCDFEDPISCQWTQDKSDDFDWTRNQASTPLEGTGPLTDHTKGSTFGWYFYIEASSPRQPNDTARLISPSTTETKSCLLFFYHMYGRHVGKLRVYVKSGGKMGLPVWSRSGEQGDKWYQAQVAVNNQTSSYQYVIEGVRGKGGLGEIAIDDISLMDSCLPRETAILPSRFICGSEDKGTTDDSSRIIIIATTLGVGVFLCIVLNIVLLIKYKRLKRAPKLSTPVNIPLEANEISPEPLPLDEEAVYETVANVDWKFHENVATNANESEAEGSTSDHEEVEVPSNAHQASGHTELNKRPDTLKRGATSDGDCQALLKEDDEYVIPVPEEPQHETPGQDETCEEPKLSPENPVYTELDVKGRNTTEDGTYQKLVKRDSDYVIPAHERR